jgi:hypothetical protein
MFRPYATLRIWSPLSTSCVASLRSSRRATGHGISSGQQLIPQDAQLHTQGRYMYMYICTARLPDSHLPVSTDTEHHTSAVPRTSRRHIARGTDFDSPKLFWNAVARNKPDKLDKRVTWSASASDSAASLGTWPGLCLRSAVSARSGCSWTLSDINPHEMAAVA